MKPPENLAVGISDLLARRECPRRAAYGARRHIGDGNQDHTVGTPEAGNPGSWYGSMIHDAIEHIEAGHSDDAAVELAWSSWGPHLGPEDLALLREDVAKFHERDFQGVRTVLAEGEIRVPLTTTEDGRPIFFRGRIDRLYERLDLPGSFIHVDYKSSKWLKTQTEAEEDLQLWSYNFLLTEYFPEIEDLAQYMDQLRGGLGEPIRKTPEQLKEIRDWLEVEARAYFAIEPVQADGLPQWRFNQWCPWCPILESCGVVPQLSDWALARIDLLSPAEDGVEHTTPIDEYIDRYDTATSAIKVLERYAESVKKLVRQTPEADLPRLGFTLSERRNSVLDRDARETLYSALGHRRFIEMAKLTKESLSGIEDPETREWALSLVQMVPGTNKVVKRLRR